MKRSCLLLVSSAISIFGIASPAFAEPVTDSTDFSITVNSYLNVTLSSSDIHLPITPSSGGTFGETSFTATSSTNNALGYSLNLAIKDTNTAQAVLTTNLTSDTINVNDGTKPVIPTFSTSDVLTSAQFSASTSTDHINHWAMSLNDTDHYKKVLSESTIATSDEPIADDVTTLNLATKLDLLTPPGSYSAYFNFEIVANVDNNTLDPEIDPSVLNGALFKDVFEDEGVEKVAISYDTDGDGTTEQASFYPLQSMTPEICNAVYTPQEIGDFTPEIQMVDTRDNKVYWVAKLLDGHCWMVQNLDLDIHGVGDLYTYEDTDVGWTENKTWENVQWGCWGSNCSNDWLYVYNGSDVYQFAQVVDYGDVYYYNGTKFSSLEQCAVDGRSVAYCRHFHAGNSYDAGTATFNSDEDQATEGDVIKNSICPAGWRLPYGQYHNQDSLQKSEYATVLERYEIIRPGLIEMGSNVGYLNNTALDRMGISPLFINRPGFFYYGKIYGENTSLLMWTSTSYSNSEIQELQLDSTTIYPVMHGSTSWITGTVRCVAR